MHIILWTIVILLSLIILLLLLKIRFMQIAAGEIEIAFAHRLTTDTNTLIDISTGDRYMRHLAARLNEELRTLRKERQKYRQGDRELKTAVTNLSHDLRTPLTALCGYLDLLHREDMSPATERYLAVMAERCETMRQLTEELFRYSVILSGEQPMEKEKTVINGVLEEVIGAFYGVLCDKNIEPVVLMPTEKVTRTLDRSSLSRVLTNLMTNAIKYTDGDLTIQLTPAGEMIFTNTATGLDVVQVGRLFDRFYTVSDGRGSTGLGLSIAKTLVQQMGGTIAAAYEGDRLSIRVWIPA